MTTRKHRLDSDVENMLLHCTATHPLEASRIVRDDEILCMAYLSDWGDGAIWVEAGGDWNLYRIDSRDSLKTATDKIVRSIINAACKAR
ncbi:MAG TPA: hypothetical protein VIV60_29630 [Polyangiaceae bacterium]